MVGRNSQPRFCRHNMQEPAWEKTEFTVMAKWIV